MPHALSNRASRARCVPLALRVRPTSACAAGGCAQASTLRVSPRALSDRASRARCAKHIPVPLMQRNRPRLRPSGSGMCAGRPTDAQHPARRDRREPSTSPCSLCNATAPACHGRRRGVRWMAHVCLTVCAASGATRSQRAENVPVPLVRGDRPCLPRPAAECVQGGPSVCRIRRVTIAASRARACAARATRPPPPATAGGVCAEGHTYVPHPVPHDCSEPSTSQCRSRDAIPSRLPRQVAGMCAARPTCVPHPASLDCCESSTSQCRSFDATPPTYRGRCAGRPKCVPHTARRVAASRARARAARATRPPPPATAGGVDACRVTQVCAASGASRSPRAQHVPVPLVRRNSPRLPRPAEGNVHRAVHACVASGASRT
jgi:hypothetical protein